MHHVGYCTYWNTMHDIFVRESTKSNCNETEKHFLVLFGVFLDNVKTDRQLLMTWEWFFV